MTKVNEIRVKVSLWHYGSKECAQEVRIPIETVPIRLQDAVDAVQRGAANAIEAMQQLLPTEKKT